MRLLYLLLLGCFISLIVNAQSFNSGIPLPGLPNSVGPKTMNNSTSVTIATDQNPIPISGTFTSSAINITTNYAAAPPDSALIGYINGSLQLNPFLGDQNGITVNARQATTPWISAVTGTVSALESGVWNVNVTNNVSSLQSGPWDIRNITGTVSLPPNAATESTQSNNGVTLTAISGKLPATLGQKTSAQSLAVVIASDQSAVQISGTVSAMPITVTASTITRFANNVVNQTLLNANVSRKQIFLYNDSTTNCYVKFGAVATLNSFTIKLFSTDTYIMDPPTYTGIIDYLCDATSGSMEVNEQ